MNVLDHSHPIGSTGGSNLAECRLLLWIDEKKERLANLAHDEIKNPPSKSDNSYCHNIHYGVEDKVGISVPTQLKKSKSRAQKYNVSIKDTNNDILDLSLER